VPIAYIIVICRQPCALHISSYTVHQPSGGVHCAWSGGYNCFQGVNIPHTGWLHKPLLGCEENSTKIFAAVFPRECVMYRVPVKRHDFDQTSISLFLKQFSMLDDTT